MNKTEVLPLSNNIDVPIREGILTVYNFSPQEATVHGVNDLNPHVSRGCHKSFYYRTYGSIGASTNEDHKTINNPSGHETIALL